MTTDHIRVLLVDDHAIVRAGLRTVLGSAPDIVVVGEAENGVQALAQAERLDPDVILMDLSMPELDGTEAIRRLVSKGGRGRVLVLSMHAEDDYLVPCLEAGAVGYLVKSAADRELISAVRAVAYGDTFVQPSATRALARRLAGRDEAADTRSRYDRLTRREREVLRFVASGYSAPEIGTKLLISPKTVDSYKQRINEKLGLSHRAEYVKFALRLGLLAS